MADCEPPERDMKDFEFMQLCKFRVRPSDPEVPINRGNLLVCSSKYGLLIYSTKQGFSAVRTAELLQINDGLGKERNKKIVEEFSLERSVELSNPALCLAVNSEGKYLAVVTREMGQLVILFFDVNGFADKASPVSPFAKAKINSAPTAAIQDLAWNPAVPHMLAVCTSDGNVELIDVTDNPKVIAALPAAVGATCFCWSPKGKQLLVGKKNGCVSQYDHALAEKKQWPCPTGLQGPQRVVDILWQSTYTFMAAYLPSASTPADQPKVVLTVSNKENKTQYHNFDDICFGNGEERKPQYFFHLLLQWEMILMASSNATEATVVGKNLDDKVSWEHWNLEDCSRAELPLTESQNDSFPVGMAIDYSPQSPIVINESVQYPACPVMFLLSTDGILLGFHLSYRHKDAAPVTSPASALDLNAARKGVPGLLGTPSPAAPLQQTQAGNTMPLPSQPLQKVAVPAAPVATATPSLFGSGAAAAPSFQFTGIGGTATPKGALSSFSLTQTAATQPPNGLAGQKPQAAAGFSAFGFSLPSTGFGVKPPPVATPVAGGCGAATSGSFAAGQSSAGAFTFGEKKTATPSSAFASVAPTSGAPLGGFAKQPAQASQSSFSGLSQLLGSSESSPATPAFSTSTPAFAASKAVGTLSGGTVKPSSAGSVAPPPSYVASKPQQSAAPQVAPPAPPTALAAPKQQTAQPQAPVESQKTIDARLDSAFTSNIFEEIRDFEEELKQVRSRSQTGLKVIGTREEMQKLRQATEKMTLFTKEIKSVTQDHTRESQEQKSMSFNLFALAEECKVKHEKDQDPHYHSLLQGRTLDPTSAERLKRLQGMAQALEQRVVEVDSVLDAQWAEHQAQRRKQSRLSTPTGDIIYKNIKNNHNLIQDQKRKLEKLEEQLTNLRLYSRAAAGASRDITALANISTGDKLAGLVGSPRASGSIKQAVAAGMTPEKVSRLRELLSQRTVPTIKSSPLANMSMSRIVAQTPKSTKSAGASSQRQSKPQSQQQLQQQLQQQQQASTPTGPPATQLAAPAGKLTFSIGQTQQPVPQPQRLPFSPAQKPGTHGGPPVFNMGGGATNTTVTQPPRPQLPQQQQQQQWATGAPTFFSGTAYFKQPTPKQTELSAALAGSANTVGGSAISAASAGGSSVSQGEHVLYEDITPTETEEDEDGYDEEEGGYEDEDDEDETGFVGIDNGVTGVVSAFGGGGGDGPGMLKVPPTLVAPPATGQPAFTPLRATTNSQALPARTDTSSAGGATTASKDLFGAKTAAAPKPTEEATKAAGFSFGTAAPAGSVFSFTKPPTTAAPTAGTATAKTGGLFGLKTDNKEGFAFGGPAVFGQKVAPPSGSAGTPALFGAQATPSKSVAFGDLSRPEAVDSLTAAPTAQNQSAPSASPTTSAIVPPASAATATMSPTSSAPPTTTTTTKSSPGASLFGVKADSSKPSIFGGGAAATTGGTFSFGSTPSSATPAASGFSFTSALSSTTKAGSTADTLTTQKQTTGFGAFSSPANSTTTPAGEAAVAPSTSKPSIFGGSSSSSAAAVTNSPLFGGAGCTTSTVKTPEVGVGVTTTTEVSAVATSTTPAGASSSSPQGADVTPRAAVTATTPLFGGVSGANQTSPGASTTTTSGGTTSLFGKPAASTTPAQSGGTFSFSTDPGPTTSATGLFGSTTLASGSSKSVFGGSKPVEGLFGSSQPVTATTTSTTGSVFGVAATPASSAGTGLFGSVSTATTTAATGSVFGGAATPTSSAGTTGLFGSVSTATTTAGSVFGGSSTSSAGTGLFGSVATATTTAGSVFGGSSSNATGSGLFGGATSSTGTGLFGSSTTPSSGFGAAGSGGGGLFGTPSTTKTTSTGLFGTNNATTASTSLFGSNPATTTASTGLFGSSSSNSGLFGQQQQQTSGPGFGFGQQTPSSGASAFGQAPAFGQQQQSSGSTSSGGLFGFSGLGGKPSEEKAKQNVFGSSQVFGGSGANQPKTDLFGGGGGSGSGLFGGSSGASSSTFGGFGSPSTNAGGGSFSSGAGGVASSGFGVAASQPSSSTSGGFGMSPAFGGSPSFGGSAMFGNKPAFGATSPAGGFGSSPAFGSAPAFGSSATFGSPQASSTGGSGNAGFSSFANAAAPSFGALAQSPPSAFGGGGAGFGSTAQPSAQPFGGGGGGFGSPQQALFGQTAASPSFGGGGAPQPGFGNAPSFGSSAAFSSYRG